MKTKEEIIQKTVEFLKEFNFKEITWKQAKVFIDGYSFIKYPNMLEDTYRFETLDGKIVYTNEPYDKYNKNKTKEVYTVIDEEDGFFENNFHEFLEESKKDLIYHFDDAIVNVNIDGDIKLDEYNFRNDY
jgi:hypothetical protein